MTESYTYHITSTEIDKLLGQRPKMLTREEIRNIKIDFIWVGFYLFVLFGPLELDWGYWSVGFFALAVYVAFDRARKIKEHIRVR